MKNSVTLTSSQLRAWADYLAWVSTAAQFQVVGGDHQCTVALPGGELLQVQACSPELLARKVMEELSSNLVAPPLMASQSEPMSTPSVQDVSPKEVSMRSHYEPALPRASLEPRSASVTCTKGTLQTIGVYVPESMHETLKALADGQDKKFSVLVRELVESAYERFEDATEERSGRKVLDGYALKVASYSGEQSQWMARLDRQRSLELKLTAKEYGRSASQFIGGLLAEELSHCMQARAEVVGNESCIGAEIEQVQAAIAGIVGPQVNALADYVGLPGKRRLVNEVLVGLVRAPGALLGRIAEYFAVSREAVTQAVSLNFRNLPAPSYKAPNVRPRVLTEPVSWEEAVKALKLPHDEEAKLLAMGD